MLAVDTNVVVRFLAHDDPEQTRRAMKLFRENRVWIAKTVLLETEWVMRGRLQASPMTIEQLFRGLGGIPTVILEDSDTVAQALEWFAEGMDFADALHLASSGEAQAFASFDRKLAAASRRQGAMPVVAP